MDLTSLWGDLKQTAVEWSGDRAPRLGAALSYYTVFAVAPLILVIMTLVGLSVGTSAARNQILAQLRSLLGANAAQFVEQLVEESTARNTGGIAGAFSVIALLVGASGVFAQLQDALDTIWGVEPATSTGFWRSLLSRWTSFAMILGVGFLLLVSLIVSAALSGLSSLLTVYIPLPELVMHLTNMGVSFALITGLFAMIYKFLPNVEIAWQDVWVGAAATSFFFTIGKFLIGLYLGQSAVASAFGAAGSLAVLLVWTYYSAQIFLFGAEFTQVRANARGCALRPKQGYVAVKEAHGERQHEERIGQDAPPVRERMPVLVILIAAILYGIANLTAPLRLRRT